MSSNIQTTSQAIVINRTLKNTYQLLSVTLFFSALMAYMSMALKLPYFGFMINIVGIIGLFFLISKLKNSALGILAVFALTGFMGLTLGPMLNYYQVAFSNGSELIAMAMTGTATVFITLSLYSIVSQKDFSFMGGFLFAGIIVLILALVANMFLNIPALSVTLSAVAILIFSGFILFDTSRIVNGGETNYIMATVSLYLSIYNLFVHMLMLLGIFGGND